MQLEATKPIGATCSTVTDLTFWAKAEKEVNRPGEGNE